ncbi:MAG: sulfotransferase family protein [Thermodesulfobacteriota bacterium]
MVVVAGMPRAGTTTLYHNLQKHPMACLPLRKETNYFSFQYDRGVAWFLKFYRHAATHQICFDISPGYFFDPHAIDRIQAFDPETKVVIGLRDPVEWVFSLYQQCAGFDRRIPPFKKFLEGYLFQTERKGKTITFKYRKGMITDMLAQYRSAFADRLLLYDFSLLRHDLLTVLQAIEAFAGISSYFTPQNIENLKFNAGYRRNNPVLAYLSRQEPFFSLIDLLLPDPAIRFLRKRVDVLSVLNNPPSKGPLLTPDNIRLAQDMFDGEHQAIKTLFANHRILLGSGAPFS